MTHETAAGDLRLIWQNQRREHSIMSEEEVRMKAFAFQAKVRRNLIVSLILSLVLLALCIIAVIQLHSIPRVIAVAMTCLIAIVTYKIFNRIRAPQTAHGDTAVNACLDFYRRDLTTQYRTVVLKWRLLIASLLFLWLTWNSLVFKSARVVRIVLPSLLVLIFFMRRREAQKLRDELAALSAFEKEEETGV